MGVIKIICSIFFGIVALMILLYGLNIFFGVLNVVEEHPIAALFAGSYLILGLLLIIVGALMLFVIIRWNRKKEPRYHPPPPPPGWQGR